MNRTPRRIPYQNVRVADSATCFVRRWIMPAALALSLTAPAIAETETPEAESAKLEYFEKNVRPLLVNNCHSCHSAETKPSGGLRVDDRNGLVSGGGRGSAIVPGKPEESLLLKAVRHEGKLKMPPQQPLPEEEIAILTKWIADGAVWPAARLPASIGKSAADYERLRNEHWSWQPLRDVKAPEVRDATWARDDIDRFVLAGLEAKGIAPVGDADKLSLLRRVTFDLTGLPPTLAEIEGFLSDASSKAFEQVVDRLLASSAFGERWGRHWLDVARYGESTGSARNLPFPHAWRYRDYVISAFNSDKPYNKFLREQLAGDLLPANSPAEKAEQLVATGFLALGVKDVNQRFKVRYIMDNVDEQIDTVSRSILGLTASCARCHDHKFDPIPTTDYYALAGIFRSTDLCDGLRNQMGGGGMAYYDTNMIVHLSADAARSSADPVKVEAAKKVAEEARKEFIAIRDSKDGDEKTADGRPRREVARQKWQKLQAEVIALTDPAAAGPIGLGVRDSTKVADTEIRIRGEAEKLGPVVPRGFLSVINVPGQPAVNPEQSGRLELARWITSEQNPLTSRVIVNRIWQHLFGAGLVKTVDNFGVTGDVPSHPELLDHLARQFVRDGWSTKKLVRAIVLTRAYQLSSEAPATHLALDPANRLVWRHSPRRLDAEEIRDAMLAVTGSLNLNRPEASAAKDFKVMELRNNGPEAKRLADFAAASPHRSVYLPLLRGLTPISLRVFDFAEQGMVSGSRENTTVAPQALYLLNDPFVRQQAKTLAERLLQRPELDDTARIQWAYRLTTGRTATSLEVERGLRYLADYKSAVKETLALADASKAAPPAATETTGEGAAAATAPEAAQTATAATGTASPTKPADATDKKPEPAQVANPDEPTREDEKVVEVAIEPTDIVPAAWTSFCQALLGSAEFRYVK